MQKTKKSQEKWWNLFQWHFKWVYPVQLKDLYLMVFIFI